MEVDVSSTTASSRGCEGEEGAWLSYCLVGFSRSIANENE